MILMVFLYIIIITFRLAFLLPQFLFPLLSSLISFPKHSPFVVAWPMYSSPLLPLLHHKISSFPLIIPSTSITYTCMNTHMQAQTHMWVYMDIHIPMYMHAHTHTHNMCTYECIQSPTNANTCTNTCEHTHTGTHKHTHTNTYARTCTNFILYI